MKNFFAALQHYAHSVPNHIALSSGQLCGQPEQVDYAKLSGLIEAVSSTLKKINSQRIGLFLDNGIDWVISDLAALNSGITLIPIPLFFSAQQIHHLYHDAGLDALIVASPTQLATIAGESVVPPYSAHKLPGLSAYLIKLETATTRTGRTALPDGTAKLTYTSGSTGAPKGVCLSAHSLMQVTQRLSDVLADLALERHLCLLPLATLLENIAGVYVPLFKGCTVQLEPLQQLGMTLSSGVNQHTFTTAFQQLKPQSIIALPQMLRLLTRIQQAEISNKPNDTAPSSSPLSDLRFIALGGSKTSSELIRQAWQLDLPVYEGYGLSECASVASLNTPQNYRAGSVGKPLLPGNISISEQGEICVHSPVMLGYAGATAQTPMPYPTGDLGYLDNDGFLYITGRRKHLIITSYGRNVSPEWVESTLENHPCIAQCMVVGDAQPHLSAIIVPTALLTGQKIITADLQRQIKQAITTCNKTLPDYARIHHWICTEQPFNAANGGLTYNGRPRREAIAAHYSGQLCKPPPKAPALRTATPSP